MVVRKDAIAAKKAATAATKATKSSKRSQIVILKVESTFLGSLGSEDQVDVEEVKSNRGVVPMTI